MLIEKQKCCGCFACANICPKKCIAMEEDEEGFLYPVVDSTRCIDCGLCKATCPMNVSMKNNNLEIIGAWACSARDQKLQSSSSSGGIFSVFAESVLSMGGIVFGAAFDENCRSVLITEIDSVDELGKLRGSKYVQSISGDVHLVVRKKLQEGRLVLFSGTPCQINALKLFLKNNYSNLICVDIICHGVPSPKLWRKHIEEMEKKKKGNIVNVNFRSKKWGWIDFGSEYCWSDNTKKYVSKDIDPYMQCFLSNVSLRPSCYSCQAKTTRCADITLGDFWGIANCVNEFQIEMGVSLAIIRSNKGKKIFDTVQGKLNSQEVDYKAAISYNHAETHSVEEPACRASVYSDLDTMNYRQFSRKYAHVSVKKKIRKIVTHLKKI